MHNFLFSDALGITKKMQSPRWVSQRREAIINSSDFSEICNQLGEWEKIPHWRWVDGTYSLIARLVLAMRWLFIPDFNLNFRSEYNYQGQTQCFIACISISSFYNYVVWSNDMFLPLFLCPLRVVRVLISVRYDFYIYTGIQNHKHFLNQKMLALFWRKNKYFFFSKFHLGCCLSKDADG